MTRSYQQMRKVQYQLGFILSPDDILQIMAAAGPVIAEKIDSAMAKLNSKPKRQAPKVDRSSKAAVPDSELDQKLSNIERYRMEKHGMSSSTAFDVAEQIVKESRAAGKACDFAPTVKKLEAELKANPPGFKTKYAKQIAAKPSRYYKPGDPRNDDDGRTAEAVGINHVPFSQQAREEGVNNHLTNLQAGRRSVLSDEVLKAANRINERIHAAQNGTGKGQPGNISTGATMFDDRASDSISRRASNMAMRRVLAKRASGGIADFATELRAVYDELRKEAEENAAVLLLARR